MSDNPHKVIFILWVYWDIGCTEVLLDLKCSQPAAKEELQEMMDHQLSRSYIWRRIIMQQLFFIAAVSTINAQGFEDISQKSFGPRKCIP